MTSWGSDILSEIGAKKKNGSSLEKSSCGDWKGVRRKRMEYYSHY